MRTSANGASSCNDGALHAPRFRGEIAPAAEAYRVLDSGPRRSPFDTAEYAAAVAICGARPCLFTWFDGDRVAGGCLGVLSGVAWWRRLEIPTAPRLGSSGVFWQGLASWCKTVGVCDLLVQSFAAVGPDPPALPRLLSRHPRFEYILDLDDEGNAAGRLTTNHRRNIAKARRLIVRRSRAPADAEGHAALIGASAERRRRRGEHVAAPTDARFHRALLQSGAAELFQAADGERVLSSILVLIAGADAYYHSAGTSRLGMALGASHFLVCETARLLGRAGIRRFNLGGASPEAAGLRRFKSGFGAAEIQLEAWHFSAIPTAYRGVRAVAARAWNRLRAKSKPSQ